jgi:hypothetical protein
LTKGSGFEWLFFLIRFFVCRVVSDDGAGGCFDFIVRNGLCVLVKGLFYYLNRKDRDGRRWYCVCTTEWDNYYAMRAIIVAKEHSVVLYSTRDLLLF